MKIYKYLKPYVLMLIGVLILTYFQVMANLQLPDYMAKIINDGIMQKNSNVVLENGGWMLLVSFGGVICTVLSGYLATRSAAGFSRDIRQKVFEKVESFSMNEFNKFSTASLITRSTNDIQQIQFVMILMLRMVLMAPFMAIGGLQKAIQSAPSLSWVIALAISIMFVVITFMVIVVLPKFSLVQKAIDKLNLVAREGLTGLRVVRAFNREKYEEQKFDEVNRHLTKLNIFINRMMMLMQPFMTLILNMSLIAIVWFGAKLIDNNTINVGNMMAFMQYSMQVIMSFLMVSIIFIMLPRAVVSSKRVSEVLSTEPSIIDSDNPVMPDKTKKGLIEFKNVSFNYPGVDLPVLSGISFTAQLGQTIAIMGSTGSGKSTLINLIPRCYDVTSGQVLVDGVNVKDIKKNDLVKLIGYVPQKNTLFSGTVESNIKYGNRSISSEVVKESSNVAQASEFVNKLKDKYNSPIAQGGSNVSGGQKQRLAIARALAIKPEILIFDDSFSALDLKTDSKLRQALNKNSKNRTTIIVAQRVSTVMGADSIIVLDEGKIVGQGRHKELMKHCKVYNEIAHSQLSDQELQSISKSLDKEQKNGR